MPLLHGVSAHFLCPTPSGLPPSCLRQCSRGALRAVGRAMGFPTAKLSKRTQGFPILPTAGCVCSWLSHLHPLESGEGLWKALNSQVTLFAPSLMWRGAESKSHTGGQRESLQAALHGQGASRHSFPSTKHMLEGPHMLVGGNLGEGGRNTWMHEG